MELLTIIKDLTAAIKAKDIGAILSNSAKLLEIASSFFSPIKAGAVGCAPDDLDSAYSSLLAEAEAYAKTTAAPEGEKADLDPATILILVQVIGTIIGWIRKK